jgi:hypothetical protein
MSFRFNTEEEYESWRKTRHGPKPEPPPVETGKHRGPGPEEAAQMEVFKVLYWNTKRFPFLEWIHASMNGATGSSKTQAGRRRACGQKSGVADICIPYARRGFHGAWLELKIAPNTLSPQQRAFLEAMSENGFAIKTCWSADDVFLFIEWYFEIKLNR